MPSRHRYLDSANYSSIRYGEDIRLLLENIKVEDTSNKSLQDVIKLFKPLENSQCVFARYIFTDSFFLFFEHARERQHLNFLLRDLKVTHQNMTLTPICDLCLNFHVFSTYSRGYEILMVAIPQLCLRENDWEREKKPKKPKKIPGNVFKIKDTA